MSVEQPEILGLISRAKEGDLEAFCEICRQTEARLVRQAMSISQNHTTAEDLAQDTLVEAWKSIRRYDGRSQFFTWLCAILLHRYYHFLRKESSGKTTAFAEEHLEPLQSHSPPTLGTDPGPDELLSRQERDAAVRECLQALPEKHRQVLYLRFYVDDSLEGIAAALGCSVGTVKSRLFNGLEKLRHMKTLSAAISPSLLPVEKL